MLTAHAIKRSQQRSIPRFLIDALIEHGDEFDGKRGCRIIAARSKLAKSELRAEIKEQGFAFKRSWENAFLVVAESEVVVTAGHRYKRIKKNI
jgi:hypothetical protein